MIIFLSVYLNGMLGSRHGANLSSRRLCGHLMASLKGYIGRKLCGILIRSKGYRSMKSFRCLSWVVRCIKSYIGKERVFRLMFPCLFEKEKGVIRNNFAPVFSSLPKTFKFGIEGAPWIRLIWQWTIIPSGV